MAHRALKVYQNGRPASPHVAAARHLRGPRPQRTEAVSAAAVRASSRTARRHFLVTQRESDTVTWPRLAPTQGRENSQEGSWDSILGWP